MAITTDYENIEEAISRLGQNRPFAPEPQDVTRRLDALVEAVEILARDRYQFPGLPDSNLRTALWKARGR